jgi:hypothetical protein
MATTFGRATWPGASACISARYTVSHGTTPGVAEFICPLGDAALIQQTGTLEFFDGNTRIYLRDCICDRVIVCDDGGGKALKLMILDRRWKWRYGAVSALFNEQDEKGRYFFNFQTVKDIVTILLGWMKEQNAIVDMPAGRTFAEMPEVEWKEYNPSQVLTSFVDSFGRVVVFQPITNRVIIVKPGNGAPLPLLDSISLEPSMGVLIQMGQEGGSDAANVDAFERPRSVQVAGAPVAFTCAFQLEAVGEEPDGEIRPIDQLSYKPVAADGGWKYQINRNFRDVNFTPAPAGDGLFVGVLNRRELMAHARKCIFKMYRIKLAYPLTT